MEFEGQYLTYEEYRILGGTLDLTSFNLLEFEARNQIDLKTQNRLINCEEIPQKVKICDFHLIEKINSYAQTSNNVVEQGNLASESTDGYSRSFTGINQVQEIVKSKNTELQDLMLSDLFGVVVNNEHIINCGVK